MIDEQLKELEKAYTYHHQSHDASAGTARAEALTAIYEIGLECIGADVPVPKDLTEDEWSELSENERIVFATKMAVDTTINQHAAAQRKAWAKACGVEDVS